MTKFENVQQQILLSNAQHQLVSAGAGSGKTTVMIKKISDLILSHAVDIDELLVVTFTVLAAGEMKDRLIESFKSELMSASEDKKAELLELIERTKTASIDTIDGFNSKTIKKYFYELNLSPNLEIISDATRDYFLTRAMKKTMDRLTADKEKVAIMLDLFAGNSRSLESIERLVLNLYENIINLQNPKQFLLDAREEYLSSARSENVLNEHIVFEIEKLKSIIKENYSLVDDAGVKEKIKALSNEINDINKNLSFITNLNKFYQINFPTFTAKEQKTNLAIKEIADGISVVKKVKQEFVENDINENFEEKNSKILEYFDIYIEILENFMQNYAELKEKNNLIDFSDLTRLMLKLLDNERIKAELADKYKYIFVDEYQDVNPLQDALIEKLTNDKTNVFMVGDVKQSIYGFRGANPECFVEKFGRIKSAGEGAFNMNVNFRSNPKIMEFINQTFSKLMTKSSADIDYKSDCIIEPKRTDIVDDDVKILLVKDEKTEEVASGIYSVQADNGEQVADAKHAEAMLVVKEITRLVGTNFYDANLKQNRTLTYKDFAILSRSVNDESCEVLIDVLRRNQIPVNISNKLDVTESEGIKLILSILKCVVGTADDVDYLSTFFALTNFNVNELVRIRDTKNSLFADLKANEDLPNIKSGFDALEEIRKMSYVLKNTELINFILNDLKLKYYFLSLAGGKEQVQLISDFLSKISPIENGLGLSEFIAVVESNVGRGSDCESMDKPNSVTIQTIHKSKGLEYPVVILFNASKNFSYILDNDTINFNSNIGLGFDYFDTVNRTKQKSITKYAIHLLNAKKGYKEELRLLYVALTRAKNKLIITGKYSKNLFEKGTLSRTNFVNLLLSCFKEQLVEGENSFPNCKINFIDEDIELNETKSTEEIPNSYLKFDYKDTDKFKITVKNTVTGLNKEFSKFVTKNFTTQSMQHEADEDRALIGTLYHKALEKLDLTAPYNKNTDFNDVDYLKIERAHETLSKLTTGATAIKKEAEFMMYLPYNKLVESVVQDKVLVQGVVDLIIEKPQGIIIVDYKFSRLPIKKLKEKYAEQLALYKLAVEEAYKKPVLNTFIYSVETGELL